MHGNQEASKREYSRTLGRRNMSLRAGPHLVAMPRFLACILRVPLVAGDWVYLAPFPGRSAQSGHNSSCMGTAQHWPACRENLAFVFVAITFCGEKSGGEGCQLSLLCISVDLTFPSIQPFQINPVNLNNGLGSLVAIIETEKESMATEPDIWWTIFNHYWCP